MSAPTPSTTAAAKLGLSVGEVVVERARLDVGGLQDLVDAGRGVALAPEQQGRTLDEGGAAAVWAGHSEILLAILERSLKNS